MPPPKKLEPLRKNILRDRKQNLRRISSLYHTHIHTHAKLGKGPPAAHSSSNRHCRAQEGQVAHRRLVRTSAFPRSARRKGVSCPPPSELIFVLPCFLFLNLGEGNIHTCRRCVSCIVHTKRPAMLLLGRGVLHSVTILQRQTLCDGQAVWCWYS